MSSTVTFGNEDEGPFYIQHIHRSGSFERTQHMHDMYELYYLYEGERMYFIRDRSYLIFLETLYLLIVVSSMPLRIPISLDMHVS